MKYTVRPSRLLGEDTMKFFERVYPGYKCTGEVLEEKFPNGSIKSWVVFKSSSPKTQLTPYDVCRDCGDHYVIARCYINERRYDRIEENSLECTYNVKDE